MSLDLLDAADDGEMVGGPPPEDRSKSDRWALAKRVVEGVAIALVAGLVWRGLSR